MNPNLPKLIAFIVGEVKDRQSYVSKTKLLKLLYLFDVSYYRKHRKTYTGLEWVYLHFGPWTNEYDSILQDLEEHSIIYVDRTDRAELISVGRRVDPEDFIETVTDELLLKGVLRKWAEVDTKKILDYVYFDTEPMIHGTRYQPLDFSLIPAEIMKEYKRTPSGKSAEEIDLLQQRLHDLLAERRKGTPIKHAQPIQYDDVFFRGMQAFEEID